MDVISIIILLFIIYSLPVFLGAIFSKEVQIYLNFTLIGVLFTLTKLFNDLFSIKLIGNFILNGGDISYSALLFTSIFLIITQPKPQLVRNLIYYILILNVFLACLFTVITLILNSEWSVSSYPLSVDLLQYSIPSLFYSFILFSGEILLSSFIFRKFIRMFKKQWASALFIALIYALVLILDGILIP